MIDGPFFELLGAHVGQALVAWLADTLMRSRESEIGDFDLSLEARENIGRQQSPVDEIERHGTSAPQDLSLVRVLKAFEGLKHHEERMRKRKCDAFGPAAPEHGPQVLAVHVLHGDVVGLVNLPQIKNLNDVGMGEQACELGFLD